MSAKVYTVENRKGGVGKTTTAVTLAVGLARRLELEGSDEAVLLIDLDAQGDSALALGLNPDGRCVSNIITGKGSLRDNVMSADRSAEGGASRPNLFLIPATDQLRSAKEQLITEFAVSSVMTQLRRNKNSQAPVAIPDVLTTYLDPARSRFKYIILDCPPTLDTFQEAIHNFADAAIVPVAVDYHGTSATAKHTRDILDDQASGIDIRIGAIVPTFVRPRHKLTQAMMKELQKYYGNLVTEPIHDTVRIREAPAYGGLTVLEHAPNNPAAHAYNALVDRVIGMG